MKKSQADGQIKIAKQAMDMSVDCPTRFSKALMAYREALRFYNHRDYPLEWARIARALGNVASINSDFTRRQRAKVSIRYLSAARRMFKRLCIFAEAAQCSLNIADVYLKLTTAEDEIARDATLALLSDSLNDMNELTDMELYHCLQLRMYLCYSKYSFKHSEVAIDNLAAKHRDQAYAFDIRANRELYDTLQQIESIYLKLFEIRR